MNERKKKKRETQRDGHGIEERHNAMQSSQRRSRRKKLKGRISQFHWNVKAKGEQLQHGGCSAL